ncbi:hypothetical protein [Acetobacter conturbans]|uniref:Uncharacterized protein n=1 Tax=Acetobacter conturbans TaxID=1737472 RepID=A0ABX0K004_9PROT|nr:hypothetical protein [Acetobacter conturbans]NHN88467.1 hypothetical protein [Acetobacter conturbans]
MLRMSVVPVLVLSSLALTAPAKAESPSPKSLLDRMTTEPWRYGGLSGTMPQRLVIGFHGTGPSSLSGEFAALDASMRPVLAGSLTGTISPAPPGIAVSCAFTVRLPDRVLAFKGTCTPDSLSGSFRTRNKPVLLSAQFQNVVSPSFSLDQYWLTAVGFREALSPTTALSPR